MAMVVFLGPEEIHTLTHLSTKHQALIGCFKAETYQQANGKASFCGCGQQKNYFKMSGNTWLVILWILERKIDTVRLPSDSEKCQNLQGGKNNVKIRL